MRETTNYLRGSHTLRWWQVVEFPVHGLQAHYSSRVVATWVQPKFASNFIIFRLPVQGYSTGPAKTQPRTRAPRLPSLLSIGPQEAKRHTTAISIFIHKMTQHLYTQHTEASSSLSCGFRLPPVVCGCCCCCCFSHCCRDSILKCIFHFSSSYMRVSFFVYPLYSLHLPLPLRPGGALCISSATESTPMTTTDNDAVFARFPLCTASETRFLYVVLHYCFCCGRCCRVKDPRFFPPNSTEHYQTDSRRGSPRTDRTLHTNRLIGRYFAVLMSATRFSAQSLHVYELTNPF